MKRKSIIWLLTLVLSLALTLPVFAETFEGSDDWKVTFVQEEGKEKPELVTNFTSNDIDDTFDEMQPGDNAIITIKLNNEYKEDTDWYMKNDVLKTLEEAADVAKGGAYTYILTYTTSAGEDHVLFDSSTVGGEDEKDPDEAGLHEATSDLADYFFLETLKKGGSSTITLEVGLDGETQGNDYQNTLAEIELNFAVDAPEEPESTPEEPDIPKTGDMTKILPYFIGMAVSGLLLLILAIFRFRGERKEKGGQA